MLFLTFSTAVRNTVNTFPSLKAKLHIWGEHIVLVSIQIPEPKVHKTRALTMLFLPGVLLNTVNRMLYMALIYYFHNAHIIQFLKLNCKQLSLECEFLNNLLPFPLTFYSAACFVILSYEEKRQTQL